MSERSPAVDTWTQVVSRGEKEGLRKRLTWSQSKATPRKTPSEFLGVAVPQGPHPSSQECDVLFSWTSADEGARKHDAGEERFSGATYNRPFEDLLAPIIRSARQRVDSKVNENPQRNVWTALEGALLGRVSRVLGRPLYAEFAAKRTVARQFGTGARNSKVDSPLYSHFVVSKKNDGLQSLFDTYPVAERLCKQITDYWVGATSEFFQRLTADRPALEDTFNDGDPLGDVVNLDADVSDPHDEGRTVFIVEFECGTKIVYKPRPIPVEAFNNRFLDWLEARGAKHPLRQLNLVERPTHGWIEFAEHRPCESEDEAVRFYQRCGMLLCIAYVFNGTDFHRENFIASGEHPVLIDMEGLLRPHFDLEERLPTQDLVAQTAKRRYNRSVLNTRMVPMLKTKDGRAVDTSSLGSGHRPSMEVRRWVNLNEDDMRPHKHAVVTDDLCKNVLYDEDGEPTYASGYLDEIVEGFEHTYEVLREYRDELLGPEGLLSEAKGTSVRFVLRGTSLYMTLLERCLHPKYLRDEVDRFIQLDVLARPLLSLDERPTIWPAVAAERRALNRMDVPLFITQADSTALTLPSGETIPDCFSRSAYDEACERLRSLDDEDLAFQTTAIREVFRINRARGLRAEVSDDGRPPDEHDDMEADEGKAETIAGTEELREAAERDARDVAEALKNRSVRGPDGSLSWLGAQYLASARRHTAGPARMNLFDGYGGTSLLFAGLAQVTDESSYEEQALAALAPLRSRLSELEKAVGLRKSVNVGGATGLGSVVAALTRGSDLLEQPALLKDARKVASLVDPDEVDHSGALDITSGAAGAVLGLLSLYDATGNEAVLRSASKWGAYLVDERTEDDDTGLRVWPSRNDRGVETGFAHGQAGVACALWRLAGATSDARFVDAANEAASYERRVLGADLEGVLDDEPSAAWSHGATGIGLSRLAGIDVANTSAVHSDLDAAIRHSKNHLLDGTDLLCCGTAGRIAFLLAAARELERPDLREAAQRGAAHLCAGARQRGSYRLAWSTNVFDTGFFQGSAGVAYTLLQAARPDTVPPAPLCT